ncbi:MAG TPA: hypothetical protein VFX98_00025, partial [Longimicrobiaceae bacterium]|nr:hypothetical protein [Longimicrobiaceae bacterium]
PAAAEAPVAVSPDTPVATDSTVVVRYEHTGTCARFLGREGQYFAYRITSVRNNGTTPFTLQPARFRFDGVAPAFMVPEFSELEVAPGAGQDAEEIFLVQRTGTGPPPRGPVPLGYDTAGVVMARGAADPEYDEEGTGCDGFNT